MLQKRKRKNISGLVALMRRVSGRENNIIEWLNCIVYYLEYELTDLTTENFTD